MTGPIDQALRERAARVIPNGMYGHQSVKILPPHTPQFFAKAEGAYLWDVDGRRYIDFMCGYGPNLFGYAHPEIDAAYKAQLELMDLATGPSSHMVSLAETFCALVDHADWAVFCKNGTDATSMALMTARAHRSKRKVLVAQGAYHGAASWCNPAPAGTVPEDRAHFIYYQYNDAASLRQAAEEAGDDLAGVFAAPFKHDIVVDQELPDPAYAQAARAVCDERDALLIVDDVRAGLRIERDSSWKRLGVQPDLSGWGKSIANGHPLSCLLGSARAREAVEKLYITGSYWFAAAAMAASLKTLDLVVSTNYLEHTIALGESLRSGLAEVAKHADLNISQSGPAQMPLIMFNNSAGDRDMKLSIAFADGMLQRGVYFHPFHNMFLNAAMTAADIQFAVDCASDVCASLHAGSKVA